MHNDTFETAGTQPESEVNAAMEDAGPADVDESRGN